MEPLPRRRKEGGGEIVEVYGFAGWIASFVAYAIYLVWAFVPESMLHAVGVTYYPSKYWAIAIPCAIFVTASSLVLAYIAVNFLSTAPLDSFDTMTDMHARPMVDREPFLEDDGTPDSASRVPDIGDMDLMTVNRMLYQEEVAKEAPVSHRAVLSDEGDRARRRLADLAKPCDSTPVFSGHDS